MEVLHTGSSHMGDLLVVRATVSSQPSGTGHLQRALQCGSRFLLSHHSLGSPS